MSKAELRRMESQARLRKIDQEDEAWRQRQIKQVEEDMSTWTDERLGLRLILSYEGKGNRTTRALVDELWRRYKEMKERANDYSEI